MATGATPFGFHGTLRFSGTPVESHWYGYLLFLILGANEFAARECGITARMQGILMFCFCMTMTAYMMFLYRYCYIIFILLEIKMTSHRVYARM